MPSAATNADSLQASSSGSDLHPLAAVGTVPGVAVRHAAGACGPGVGRLRYTAEGLAWRAPGSATWGDAVEIAADGEYLLEDGEDDNAYLRVEAWTAHLVIGAEAEINLADTYQAAIAGDDITASEAAVGDQPTHQITLTNESAATIYDVVAWIDPGADAGLEISDDGSTWVAPSSAATGLSLAASLASEASVTLHVRRTITAGASADSAVFAHVRIRFRRAK